MTDQSQLTQAFLTSKRPHILMVTNHGIHDWDVRSGLKDTGGQNHYVNALSETLVELGYRVTTFNRGGFKDPLTNEIREGTRYKGEHQRIVYLQGGGSEFIRKEDLTRGILEEEATFAERLLRQENLPCDLIISHYWDGAMVAHLIRERMALTAKHVWIPHSLGALKKENFKHKPQEVIASCRFDERIAYEKDVLPHVHAVASTSSDISRVLKESYGRDAELFLPPCINTAAIKPIELNQCNRVYDFLATTDAVSGKNVRGRRCLLEVSRTDRTKRKDLLINAFAAAHKKHPDTTLLLTLSPDNKELYDECMGLIAKHGIRDSVVIIGMIPRELMSELYAITTVYCSPSEMEGFGMSVQEACASARATVSSDLVPFAVEYLLENATLEHAGSSNYRLGKAGIVCKAGDTDAFAAAIERLFADDTLRTRLAKNAYDATIPYFTWPRQTRRLLEQMGMNPPVKTQ